MIATGSATAPEPSRPQTHFFDHDKTLSDHRHAVKNKFLLFCFPDLRHRVHSLPCAGRYPVDASALIRTGRPRRTGSRIFAALVREGIGGEACSASIPARLIYIPSAVIPALCGDPLISSGNADENVDGSELSGLPSSIPNPLLAEPWTRSPHKAGMTAEGVAGASLSIVIFGIVPRIHASAKNSYGLPGQARQ